MKKYLVQFYATIEATDLRHAHTLAEKIVDAVVCDDVLMHGHGDPVKDCDIQDVELVDEEDD